MWFVVAIREKRAIGCRSALDIKMKWSFETVALSLRNIFACAIHTQIQLCVVCCGCLWWIKTIAMMNDVIERWNEKQHQSLYSRWFFFLLPAFLRCQRYKFTQFLPAVKVVTTNNPIGWLSLIPFRSTQPTILQFQMSSSSLLTLTVDYRLYYIDALLMFVEARDKKYICS